jgi:hypothetical protein
MTDQLYCTVSGRLTTLSGDPRPDQLVRVRLVTAENKPTWADVALTVGAGPVYGVYDLLGFPPAPQVPNTGISVEPVDLFTDSDGAWEIDLPYDKRFRIEIPAASLDAVGTVPAKAACAIEDITLIDGNDA